MTAIRAIFDGKAFIPQELVSLPTQSEVLVLVDATDPVERARLDNAVRAYYQSGSDADDEAWARAAGRGSHLAWDEV